MPASFVGASQKKNVSAVKEMEDFNLIGEWHSNSSVENVHSAHSRQLSDLRTIQLVNVTDYAKGLGFIVPVSLSRKVWDALIENAYEDWDAEQSMRIKERRIFDLLLEARKVVQRSEGTVCSARFSQYRLTGKVERRVIGKAAVGYSLIIECTECDCSSPRVVIFLESEGFTNVNKNATNSAIF